MPIPAERLEVKVVADTSQAERKLKLFNAQQKTFFSDAVKGSQASSKSTKTLDRDIEGAARTLAAFGKESDRTTRGLRGLSNHFKFSSSHIKDHSINVDRASRSHDGLIRRLRDANIKFSFFSNIIKLVKFPAMIAGAGLAASAISAFTGSVVALGSALGPVLGMVGAAPGLLAALGQGVGVSIAAFSGLTDIMKLSSEVTEAAGLKTKTNSKALAEARKVVAGYEAAQDKGVQATRQQTAAYKEAKKTIADYEKATEAATQANEEYNEALKKFHPSVRDLIPVLKDFGKHLADTKKIAQGGIFPGVTSALKDLHGLFPTFNGIVRETSGVLGELIAHGGKLVSSGPFASDIATVGKSNSVIIRDLGMAFWSVVDAMRNVMVVAAPTTEWVGKLGRSFAEYLAQASAAGRESGKMAAFFARARLITTQWGRVIRDLGAGLFNIFKGATPLGMSLLATLGRLSRQFRLWTETLRGRNQIAKYFRDIRPALTEAGRLIGALALAFGRIGARPELAGLITQLREQFVPALEGLINSADKAFTPALINLISELATAFATLMGHSGALTRFVEVIGTVVGWFNKLSHTSPQANAAIASFASTLGILKAFKMTKKLTDILGFTGPNGLIASTGKATGAVRNFFAGLSGGGTGKAAVFGTRVRLWASSLADLGRKAVSNGKKVVTWLGNMAAAAVKEGAKGVLWTGKFAAKWIVLGAKALLGAAKVAAAWLIAMGPIAIVIAAVIGLVYIIIRNWDTIKRVTGQLWSWIKKTASDFWQWLQRAFDTGLRWIRNIWNMYWNIYRTILGTIINVIRGIISGAWNFLRSAFRTGLDFIRGLWNRIWGGIRDTLSRIWDNIRDRARGAMEGLQNIVRGAVRVIGDIFQGVKSAFAAPINWVIRNVINKFLSGVNSVAGALGIGLNIRPIGEIGGDVIRNVGGDRGLAARAPRFHEGGIYNSAKDEGMALLQRGEGILPRKVVQDMGPAAFDALRQGDTDFIVPKQRPGKPLEFGDFWGPIKGIASDLWGKVRKIISAVARPVIEAGMRGIDGLAGMFGNPGRLIGGAARKLGEGVLQWIAGADKKAAENEVPALTGGIGWQKMWDSVRAAFGGAVNLHSAFRPGAITATGNPSYHGMGRAIDITPSMAIFDWIKKNYMAQTRELIYSPANAGQVRNGRSHYYTGITRQMHFNHIHWAMKNGGVITGPTRAILGETARSRPEIVTPERLMRSVFRAELDRPVAAGGRGNVYINLGGVTFDIDVDGEMGDSVVDIESASEELLDEVVRVLRSL
jgi:hypothetical protein